MDSSQEGIQHPDSIRNPALFRELLIVSGLILLALWIPPLRLNEFEVSRMEWLQGLMRHPGPNVYLWRIAEQVILPLVGLFILWSLIREKRDWKSAGLTFQNYGAAIRILAGPTLLGVAVLVAIGWAMHSLDLGTDRFWRKLTPNTFLGQYAQQAVIQLYFNHRAMQIWGKGPRSLLWVTGIFAALHLPNPALTLGVAYGMWFWASSYQKAPNILAIACSHMILSAFLWHTLPEAWRPSLTVGWRFIERSHWF